MIDTRAILEANSNRNIGLLYRWLHECIDASGHSECKRSLTGIHYDDIDAEYLPSRIIHVGPLWMVVNLPGSTLRMGERVDTWHLVIDGKFTEGQRR